MLDELDHYEMVHGRRMSPASSTVPSVATPISTGSSTPPEYLFQDYASPITPGLQSYPRPQDDDHSLLAYQVPMQMLPPHPRPSPLLLSHYNYHPAQQASPVSPEPLSAASTTSHASSRPESQPLSATSDATPIKRPRGRPRKHPVVPPSTIPKGQKGARSKTGCGTCRRRKKKCDEAKPICLNCQKNGVQCEGYRPVESWKSGADGKGNKRVQTRASSTPTKLSGTSLPSVLPGVETDLDQKMLDHFNSSASQTFASWSTRPAAFRDLFVPLAMRNQGVMHALLALSGSHLHNQQPSQQLTERVQYHRDVAIETMNRDEVAWSHQCDVDNEANHSLAAQAILLCLQSGVTGNTASDYQGYRIHWNAIAHLGMECPCKHADPRFQAFVNDFATFHGICQAVTTLGSDEGGAHPATFQLPSFVSPEAGSFLGAFDGVFLLLSKMTSLRKRVRKRRQHNLTPHVDARDLEHARHLEVELDEWVCNQSEGSLQWTTGHLYRVCARIFLMRTIFTSAPTANLQRGVEEGLDYLSRLLPEPSTHGVLLMPLFLLGCAAFEARVRPQISRAFEDLRQSRSSESISRAHDVVKSIWALMDAGDPASWDWEMVMTRMGWDFMVT